MSPLSQALDAYALELEKSKGQVRNILKKTKLEPSMQLSLVYVCTPTPRRIIPF
ncbi:hypothetical protein Syun_010369 [Stephania yunnanensis]|uniref:Uncharacterized protein n=1 Tax=Stephania yunnanensis TaxID=152371 RepID=A0AAP0KHB8_9MAGN